MKVRAVFPNGGFGFSGTRRRDGDEFEIADGRKLGSWMEAVEEPKKKRGRKPKPKPEVEAEKAADEDGAE